MTRVNPDKIRAHGPWVLMQLQPPTEKLQSGIIIPATSQELKLGYCTALIKSVGSGVSDKKTGARKRVHVEPGELVVMRRYLTEINHIDLDESHVFVHMDDLVAVVDDAKIEILRAAD